MRWQALVWLAWMGALGVGAGAVAQFGTHGTWYVGFSLGAVVGMATWFPRPPLSRQRQGRL